MYGSKGTHFAIPREAIVAIAAHVVIHQPSPLQDVMNPGRELPLHQNLVYAPHIA